MSRGRFGLLLGLVVAVVAAGAFAVTLTLITDDDDGPSGAAGPSSTTSTTAATSTTVPGELTTPIFVAIVSSEETEPTALALRDELTEAGYDAGVLRSDDYGSLEPGFWVAYVGPFPDGGAATAARDELVADGYRAAYASCVGTAEECA